MAKLYVERGPLRGKEVFLEEGKVYVVGRDAKCALSFPDSLTSRQHFSVGVSEGRYYLRDLGSSNGTFVNGEQVERPRELKLGDQIDVGETLVSLLADDERANEGGLVGREIAGYRILERVGRGGMGTVYRAHQVALGRDVAFKVLSASLAWDKEFIRRFTDEVRSASRLVHPNIVRALDVGREGTIYYFVMEYMSGGSIMDKVDREGRIAPDRAAPMLVDVARGLAYAEERGVIHRDIKPDNLMLDEQGAAKIIDLGIACEMEGRRKLAQTEGVFGSPHYIAPEQAAGDRIDARADIYGLGASAYHMLSGRTIFSGESQAEIMEKHINDEPEPLQNVAPWVPRSLCNVVMTMVERDPDDRYQSAKQVIAALENLSAEAAVSRHPAELRHIGKLVERSKTDRYQVERRNKLVIAGVIGGLVLLAVLIFLITRL